MLWYQQSSQVKKKRSQIKIRQRDKLLWPISDSMFSVSFYVYLCFCRCHFLCLCLFLPAVSFSACPPPLVTHSHRHHVQTHTCLHSPGKKILTWCVLFFFLLWGFLSLFDHTATTKWKRQETQGAGRQWLKWAHRVEGASDGWWIHRMMDCLWVQCPSSWMLTERLCFYML